MYTDYPQLIHWLSTGVTLLISIGAIGYGYTTRRYLHTKSAAHDDIARLRGEVAEFSGNVADLADRFSRFQKREGMRVARSEKERNEDMKREAAEILASQGAPEAPEGKLGLYRRRRGA